MYITASGSGDISDFYDFLFFLLHSRQITADKLFYAKLMEIYKLCFLFFCFIIFFYFLYNFFY